MTSVTREYHSRPNGSVDEDHRLNDLETGFGGMSPPDLRRMLSREEFCFRYGIGKTKTYAEMKAGRLPFCQHGGKRLIHVDDAEAWALSTRTPTISVAHPAAGDEQ